MRLKKNAKVELLKTSPLFAGCSNRELDEIASVADEIDLPTGKELTREGERGREFFVLIEGLVDVYQDGKKLRTLGPGDFLGEIALVAKTPRTATVTARCPVRALVVTEQSFHGVLEKSPEIRDKILQALAERLAPTAV
jgi:CRP-like cAMP-binding protein